MKPLKTKRKWPQLCLLPLPVLDTIFFGPRRDNFNIVFLYSRAHSNFNIMVNLTFPLSYLINSSFFNISLILFDILVGCCWLISKVLNFSQLHTLISFILGSYYLPLFWGCCCWHTFGGAAAGKDFPVMRGSHLVAKNKRGPEEGARERVYDADRELAWLVARD